MPRPLWRGAISPGLVTIPVSLGKTDLEAAGSETTRTSTSCTSWTGWKTAREVTAETSPRKRERDPAHGRPL